MALPLFVQPGLIPRNRSDRQRRSSIVVSRMIEMLTRIGATARIVGELRSRRPVTVCPGRVFCPAEPTGPYNRRVKEPRDAVRVCEDDYRAAKAAGNADGMKKADHQRKQVDEAVAQMEEVHSGLSRFSRTHAHVAQLIDPGDPEMENVAAFSMLRADRLDGVTAQNADLRGRCLSGWMVHPG